MGNQTEYHFCGDVRIWYEWIVNYEGSRGRTCVNQGCTLFKKKTNSTTPFSLG